MSLPNPVAPRGAYPPVVANGVITAAVTASVLPAIAGVAKETIYITKIVINITTSAAGSITFRDTNGTPRVAFVVAASAPIGNQEVDFGEDGFPLQEGEGLNIVGSASGPAGAYHVQGYRRATSPRTIAEAKAGIA
jgi:hypothetical protein